MSDSLFVIVMQFLIGAVAVSIFASVLLQKNDYGPAQRRFKLAVAVSLLSQPTLAVLSLKGINNQTLEIGILLGAIALILYAAKQMPRTLRERVELADSNSSNDS